MEVRTGKSRADGEGAAATHRRRGWWPWPGGRVDRVNRGGWRMRFESRAHAMC